MNSSPVDARNPWLGLASFTEESRVLFCGRDDEVADLVRRVRRKQLTVLFGQSGLGKTSLIHAGLVPALRPDGFCPIAVRLHYEPDAPRPAEQIKQAVFRVTAEAGTWTKPGSAQPGETLWEFFHHRDDVLRDATGRVLTPLLIFDQFEEVFTVAQSDDAGRARARTFLADLADLVENRATLALEQDETAVERFDFARGDYRVLVSLREDYLASLEGLKDLMPSVTQNRVRLTRMNGAQALEAVLQPGAGIVSEDVTRAIVRFVAGGAEIERAEVEPSLLSLVCRELNEARLARGAAEISADLLAGSHDTILSEFYERAVADQPAGGRQFIEDHLLTDSGFRESVAEERVQKAFAEAGAPGALAALVDRRLLRIEERLDVRRVELTHDVLCSVVAASRDTRQQRRALEQARERERRTRRRYWFVGSIAAGLVVLLAGVSWVAWRAIRAEREQSRLRSEAEEAHAREAAQRHRAEAQAYAADMSVVQQTLAYDNLGHAQELLDRHRPTNRLPLAGGGGAAAVSAPRLGSAVPELQNDLRGWEWRYLWQFCHSDATSSLGHATERIDFLAASHDGTWLAHGNSSGGLSIWNLATREETRLPAGEDIENWGAVVKVAFSPREPLLAFAVNNLRQSQYSVRLWSGATQRIVAELPMATRCIGLAFSGDGKTLVTLTEKDQLALWRVTDGVRLASYPTPTASHWICNPFAATEDLSAVAYASDASGRGENLPAVHVLDLATGQERWTAKGTELSLTAFAFSPDGKTLASSWGVDAIALWDAASGKSLGFLRGHRTHVSALVFWPDGRALASGGLDQTIRVWDLADLNHLPPSRVFRGHKTEVKSLVLLPDHKTLVSGGKDGAICFWDTTAAPPPPSHVILPPGIADWRFAADSQAVLAVDRQGQVAQWSGASFQGKKPLLELGVDFKGLAWLRRTQFSADGRLLAASSTDGTLRVWDLERRTVVHQFMAPQKGVFPREFLGGGTRLVFWSDGSFHEWDLVAGREVQSWRGATPYPAFSCDELWCLTVADGTGQLRDMTSGRDVTFPLDIGHVNEAGYPVALSPDGRLFAAGSGVGYFILGETAKPRDSAVRLHQYTSACFSVAFSPDGQRLAVGSGSRNQSIKLWDAELHQELLNLETEGGQFGQMAFSADGNLLGCCTFQGVLHVWRAPSWTEIEQAERNNGAPPAPSARSGGPR
jgi:WD40 repeat protein